jgi:hypothetical protein
VEHHGILYKVCWIEPEALLFSSEGQEMGAKTPVKKLRGVVDRTRKK